MHCQRFFDELWRDFSALAPTAAKIRERFEARGEQVVNDHVAFRTFNQSPISLADLEPHLLALGYEPFAPYHFPGKHLRAVGYVHSGAEQPRLFLSELLVEECSALLQETVKSLVRQISPSRLASAELFGAGKLWEPITYASYERLAEESEYAGWLAALGFHANHFTVSVNALKTFGGVAQVLDFVEQAGFAINDAGGRVKGSPADLLEQGATLADVQAVEFAEGELHPIPTGYYEFALRYPNADGKLYDGFVAASADKIFQSTHRR